jgi:hypothetical protein
MDVTEPPWAQKCLKGGIGSIVACFVGVRYGRFRTSDNNCVAVVKRGSMSTGTSSSFSRAF